MDAAIAVLANPFALFVLPEAAGCSVVEASAELEQEEDHDEDGEHEEEDGEEGHEEHEGHTEFHANYLLSCTDISKIGEMTFGYFEAFPNALELEVQVISEDGATAFEVMKDNPVLDLGALF